MKTLKRQSNLIGLTKRIYHIYHHHHHHHSYPHHHHHHSHHHHHQHHNHSHPHHHQYQHHPHHHHQQRPGERTHLLVVPDVHSNRSVEEVLNHVSFQSQSISRIHPSFVTAHQVIKNSRLQVSFGTRSKECRKSLWKNNKNKNNNNHQQHYNYSLLLKTIIDKQIINSRKLKRRIQNL